MTNLRYKGIKGTGVPSTATGASRRGFIIRMYGEEKWAEVWNYYIDLDDHGEVVFDITAKYFPDIHKEFVTAHRVVWGEYPDKREAKVIFR